MKIELTRRKNIIARHPKIVIAAAVLLIAFGFLLAGLLLNHGPAQEGSSPNAVVDANAEDWDGNLDDNAVGKGNPDADSIAIPGYPKIYLPAGETEVSVTLGNPEGNPCYFTYTMVLLNDEGNETETLYTSQQIPPGQAVKSITLNRGLEKGEYSAMLKISTAHLETQGAMNGANVKTTLIVE